jgi:hypothetical protein
MDKLPPLETQIREALAAIGFLDLMVDPDGYRAPSQVGELRSQPDGVASAGGTLNRSSNIYFDPTASLSY